MQSISGQFTSSAAGAAVVGAGTVLAGVGEGEILQLSLIRGRSIFSGP